MLQDSSNRGPPDIPGIEQSIPPEGRRGFYFQRPFQRFLGRKEPSSIVSGHQRASRVGCVRVCMSVCVCVSVCLCVWGGGWKGRLKGRCVCVCNGYPFTHLGLTDIILYAGAVSWSRTPLGPARTAPSSGPHQQHLPLRHPSPGGWPPGDKIKKRLPPSAFKPHHLPATSLPPPFFQGCHLNSFFLLFFKLFRFITAASESERIRNVVWWLSGSPEIHKDPERSFKSFFYKNK